jgi:quercetin dioxygenase-like cupin family protein
MSYITSAQEVSSLTTSQLPAAEKWSSFFQNLPEPFSGRVKRRDAICNVRILTNDETGGPLSVKIFSTHGEEAPHTHYETKQIFTVLDGELTVWLVREGKGRIEQTLRQGQTVTINPGELHGFSGTALIGGVDIGKGTTLDTYKEDQCPKTFCEWKPKPMKPLSQGTVTIQNADFEQRDLLSSDPNFGIKAVTVSTKYSLMPESAQVGVIVSGAPLITSSDNKQAYQPGDHFFVSQNKTYTITTDTETPAIMIFFTIL